LFRRKIILLLIIELPIVCGEKVGGSLSILAQTCPPELHPTREIRIACHLEEERQNDEKMPRLKGCYGDFGVDDVMLQLQYRSTI